MQPDQIFDKRTIGIPEDIVLIRQQVKELRDEAAELVERAIAYVVGAERAEEERQRNELARMEAEAERAFNYERIIARVEKLRAMLGQYQSALDALGSLHDEHDYMVLGSALHTRNGTGAAHEDGFKLNQGTYDGEDGLSIAGTFYGLEDAWLN